MDLDLLSEPFHVSQIHWRVGSTNKEKTSGMALAYLDARDVEDRLDEIVGRTNWQSKHEWSEGSKVQCSIGIRVSPTVWSHNENEPPTVVPGEWVWKSDGAGETAFEGEKGAFSGAFKRAGASWGIGRYLYQSPDWWEQIVPSGKSYRFTDTSIKSLNGKYDQWLLPGRQEAFNDAYGKHFVLVDSLVDALTAGDIEAGADYWRQIPEKAQRDLWLAKGSGGLFDQAAKKLIRSTGFSVATAKLNRGEK